MNIRYVFPIFSSRMERIYCRLPDLISLGSGKYHCRYDIWETGGVRLLVLTCDWAPPAWPVGLTSPASGRAIASFGFSNHPPTSIRKHQREPYMKWKFRWYQWRSTQFQYQEIRSPAIDYEKQQLLPFIQILIYSMSDETVEKRQFFSKYY